jgi:putative PIN family toxin of toxin-antitoxin system
VKVVLDTNVVVSGIFFSGPPREILQSWSRGKIQLLITSEIFEEYQRVAAELNQEYPSIEIRQMLELILVGSELVVAAPLPRPICNDPDDDKFFDCAAAGGVPIIVSGDRHLLKASGAHGITVVTPRYFKERYLKNQG